LPLPQTTQTNRKGKVKRACLPTNPAKKFSKMPDRTTKTKYITADSGHLRHGQNSTGHNSTLPKAG
jgi:hypothetical protein